jgi:hypothetical protein
MWSATTAGVKRPLASQALQVGCARRKAARTARQVLNWLAPGELSRFMMGYVLPRQKFKSRSCDLTSAFLLFNQPPGCRTQRKIFTTDFSYFLYGP